MDPITTTIIILMCFSIAVSLCCLIAILSLYHIMEKKLKQDSPVWNSFYINKDEGENDE